MNKQNTVEGKKILHLILKKKWFDMIASGEKKEEYRGRNPHYASRLKTKGNEFKNFDVVVFQHGYASNAPRVTVECLGITTGQGTHSWGAELDVDYFVIKLGKILNN